MDIANLFDNLFSRVQKEAFGTELKSEIYYKQKDQRTFELRDGRLDMVNFSSDAGIALRIESGSRVGFGFSSVFSDEALSSLVKSAVISMQEVSSDVVGLAELNAQQQEPLEELVCSLEIKDNSEISGEQMKAAVFEMESAALGDDSRVKRARSATASFAAYKVALARSNGAFHSYDSTLASGSVSVIADDGSDVQMGSDYDYKRFYKNLDFSKLGVNAARVATGALQARKIASSKVDVLFSAEVAAELLDILVSSLSAENVLKGKSMLAGKTGEKVFSDKIDIVDDGRLQQGVGSAPFDDDGWPTGKTSLVSGGVLCGYLHSWYSASKMQESPTGNGFRGGYRVAPTVNASNLFVKPGSESFEEIVGAITAGLYVKDAMGLHTVNPVSGDFSIAVSGEWISGGHVAYPVREVVLAGNLKSLFADVVKVGSELRFYGNIGSPVLLVQSVSLSGN